MTALRSPLSKLPLLLLTLLLTPATGLASPQETPSQEPSTQEAAPAPAQEQKEAEAPKLQEPEKLRLLDESELPRERASREARIGAELGLGLLTGAAGGILGTLVLGLTTCGGNFGACYVGSVLGIHLGFALAAPLGVSWAGSAMGADGNYGSALLGSLVGGVIGVLLYFPLGYAALAAPLLGAVIGYGMSISPEPEAPAVALGSTRVRPLLSVSPKGAFVGLGGHF